MQRKQIKAGVEYAVETSGWLQRDKLLGGRSDLTRVVFADPADVAVDDGRQSTDPERTYLHGRYADTGEALKVEPRMVLATWADYDADRNRYEAAITTANAQRAAQNARRLTELAEMEKMGPNVDDLNIIARTDIGHHALCRVVRAAYRAGFSAAAHRAKD